MPVVHRTAQITSMIFVILIGATLFSLVFRGLGGDDMVHRALSDLPGGTGGAVLVVMVAMFLLGFVMDAFEIIFVVVPIVAPALLTMPGVDPVWLGIMMAMNLQTSYLHPPLGPTLFYLRGVAPPEITTAAHLCRRHSVRADSVRGAAWCCGSCRGLRPGCRTRFMAVSARRKSIRQGSDYAVDLKFLSILRQALHRNFKSETALEFIDCECPFDSEVRV